jgi:hypothetical protein
MASPMHPERIKVDTGDGTHPPAAPPVSPVADLVSPTGPCWCAEEEPHSLPTRRAVQVEGLVAGTACFPGKSKGKLSKALCEAGHANRRQNITKRAQQSPAGNKFAKKIAEKIRAWVPSWNCSMTMTAGIQRSKKQANA